MVRRREGFLGKFAGAVVSFESREAARFTTSRVDDNADHLSRANSYELLIGEVSMSSVSRLAFVLKRRWFSLLDKVA